MGRDSCWVKPSYDFIVSIINNSNLFNEYYNQSSWIYKHRKYKNRTR